MTPPQRVVRQNAANAREISDTNNTVNQFLGGKRKSWMVDAAGPSATTPAHSPRQPAQPSPRRADTGEALLKRARRATPSTAAAEATLPSPVLTDEPSPAAMNRAQEVSSSTTNMPGAPRRMDVSGPSQPAQAAQDTQREPARPSAPQQQFHTHSAPSIGTYVYSRPNPPNSEHASKRRRITQANSPSLTQYYPILENYVQQCRANGESFSPQEQTRFGLLQTACTSNDYFYIAFHQILCMWFADRNVIKDTIAVDGVNSVVLDNGLCHMTHFLMSQNAAPVAVKHGQWFMTFPIEFNHLRTYSDAYRTAVGDVTTALIQIAQHLDQYLEECKRRGYPPLADELIGRFRVPSPIIQTLMFTWIRLNMNIPTDQYSEAMLREFAQSQNFNRQLSARINTNMPPTQRELEDATNYTSSQYLRIRRDQEQYQRAAAAHQPLAQNLLQPSPRPGFPSPAQSPTVGQRQQQFQAQEQPIRRPSSVQSPLSIGSPRPPALQSPGLRGGPFVVPASATQSRQSSLSGPSSHVIPSNAPSISQVRSAQWQPQPQQQYQAGPMMPQQNPGAQYSFGRMPNQPPVNPHTNTVRLMQGGPPPQPAHNTHHFAAPSQPFFARQGELRPAHLPNPDRTALHMFDRRSPTLKPVDRKAEAKGKADDRYYQTVRRCVVGPTILNARYTDVFDFKLDDEAIKKLPKATKLRKTDPELREVEHGSLMYRVRCVVVPNGIAEFDEAKFVVADTTWPPHLTIEARELDGSPASFAEFRRKQQYGKDLPLDITKVVTNFFTAQDEPRKDFSITVALSRPEKHNTKYAIAVEEVEVVRHDIVAKQILDAKIEFKTTEDGIKKLLAPSPDDDDDIIMNPADLTIGLQDPWLAKLWKTPVKGIHCLHKECFDLDTFLETRPETRREKSVIHYEKDNGGAFISGVDVWRCPLCGEDARPEKLAVDEWMQHVRERLVAEGTAEEARDIVVGPDGSWKVKEEAEYNKTAHKVEELKTEDDEKKTMKVVEVIDLDDD